jgi:hypothetical protein
VILELKDVGLIVIDVKRVTEVNVVIDYLMDGWRVFFTWFFGHGFFHLLLPYDLILVGHE